MAGFTRINSLFARLALITFIGIQYIRTNALISAIDVLFKDPALLTFKALAFIVEISYLGIASQAL